MRHEVPVHPLLHRIIARATRSPLASRLLLGGRFPALAAGEHYFDATTLALLRKARQRIPRGSRVLDLGCGSAAAIGLWLWRRLDCRVSCTDVDPAIAARAAESVRANGAPIPVACCSLFEGLAGEYDLAVFNPPYVPTETGRRRGLPERYRTQWDGGPDGTRTIRAFLRAFATQELAAAALMGVNRRHVPRKRIAPHLDGAGGFSVEEVWAHPWLPVDVYVLVRTKSPMARTSSPVE